MPTLNQSRYSRPVRRLVPVLFVIASLYILFEIRYEAVLPQVFKVKGAAWDAEQQQTPVNTSEWNYEAINDVSTTQHIFGLGKMNEHVAVFKPLCVHTTSGKAVLLNGSRVFSGLNRTAGWTRMVQKLTRRILSAEHLLNVSDEKPKKWLHDEARNIHWVNGLTVFQMMDRSCGNIAHFCGRAFFLQHVLDNIAAYVAPPRRIENVLVVPTTQLMERFLDPRNYRWWHKNVLSAIIAPAQFSTGTLGDFLNGEEASLQDRPRVQLLHNLSMDGSVAANKKYVCFRRAIVPGFLKGRLFVGDMDYPSTQPSGQSTEMPSVPRDSLQFRRRVRKLLHGTMSLSAMKREILLLDRGGSRRVLDNATKSAVIARFEKIAAERGYIFKVVSFDDVDFRGQVEMVQGAAIAIGVHGANLVNTIFMPPLAVLIELFPFGFMHHMYANGGNAGLKYFKHQMRSGVAFGELKAYTSVEQCIKLNATCKVHYRDAVLKATDEDMGAMEAILKEAIAWRDERFRIDSEDKKPGKLLLAPFKSFYSHLQHTLKKIFTA